MNTKTNLSSAQPPFEFYQFKEVVEQEGMTRYCIPRSDPYIHEMPFDFVFNTPAEAYSALEEFQVPEDESACWTLMKIREESVNDLNFRAEAIEKITASIRREAESMERNGELVDSYVSLRLKGLCLEDLHDSELVIEMFSIADDEE